MTAPAIRLRQGLRAMFAFAAPIDDVLINRVLTPPLAALFFRMTRSEQLHSLHVLQDVLAQSDHTPDTLAIAALLHDCGKSRYPLWLWQRTLPVITRRISKTSAIRLSRGDPRNVWVRPYVVYAHHAAWSAELLRAAGAPEDSVWLVQHHGEGSDRLRDHRLHALLLRLQAADDAN
jgi:hypothetical protein